MFELIFILAIAFIPMLWVRSANKLDIIDGRK